MNWKLWVDILGWIGSVEVVLAYAFISTNRITARNIWYQVLNGTGALLLIINTIYYGAFPSTFINLVWLVIAAVALYRIFTARH